MSKTRKKKRKQSSPSISPKGSDVAQTAGERPDSLPRALLREPVALGLALFVFLRPWRDGLTFPSVNIYFTGLIVVLTALWGVRLVLRRESVRFPIPMALLGAYLLIAYLTSFTSIQYDLTYRALLNLTGYAMLAFLCCNALRTRLAISLVMSAFVLTFLLNSLWTIFHTNMSLPALREALLENPDILALYFGETELNPELKHRLEMNRAFGTFLFPNALGAFLILGLPYLLLGIGQALRDTLTAFRSPSPANPNARVGFRWTAELCAIFASATLIYLAFSFNYFLGGINPSTGPPIESLALQLLLLALAPIACVAAGYLLYRRYGLETLGNTLRFGGFSIALLGASYALWLSYSRGAILALGVALLVSIALAIVGDPQNRLRLSRSVAATALLFALIGSQFLSGQPAGAQEIEDPGLKPSRFSFHIGMNVLEGRALQQLDTSGLDRKLEDLGNLNSFELRVTYWQVALLIFKDNLLTGTGLGAFKAAYPKHQFLGAGDVEAAHNDYLQAFVETGLLGGIAFSAFWIYFAVWGGRRILREPDRRARWKLAGLYGGILAFTLHSLVDFNFANASLAGIVFALVGLFYAQTTQSTPEPQQPKEASAKTSTILGGSLLAIVALMTVSLLRVFFFDHALTEGRGMSRLLNIGDRKMMPVRLTTAHRMIREIPALKMTPSTPPPYVRVSEALLLIPNLESLKSVGDIRVPVQGALQEVPAASPMPDNALLFITKRGQAARLALEMAEKRAKTYEELDQIYPHDPELAAHIYTWWKLLVEGTRDLDTKKRHIYRALDWSQTAVDRSPESAWFHAYHGEALWMKGRFDPGPDPLEYYYQGLEEYRTTCDLYPISAQVWVQYGQALQSLGGGIIQAGRQDEGRQLIEQGKEALQKGNLLANYKSFERSAEDVE